MGFGNRVTDARAYQSAGVDPACIFILNPSSGVSLWKFNASRSRELGDMDSKIEHAQKTQQETYSGYDDLILTQYVRDIVHQNQMKD